MTLLTLLISLGYGRLATEIPSGVLNLTLREVKAILACIEEFSE